MKRSAFFRSPYFWIGLFVIAIASIIFLYFNFEKANPLVNISVEMNRDEAMQKASQLAIEYQLGPSDFKEAASFRNDTRFQNYSELEGGGLAVFNEMIQNDIYQSYQWKVRHFKEKEVNEVTFSFTPSGQLYGFAEKVGEDVPGAALDPDSALQIANKGADVWQVDLANYHLIEKSMDQKTGGRIDHEFVYERDDVKVNESKFRISINVSGDKVTAIKHFVKIPDDFDRRYSEMRSANDLIATIGQSILFLLYGLIGVGVGIFFLLKRRFILWKKALYWSIAIGLGTGLLDVLNVMPLLWFNYDTSEAAGSFMGQQLLYGLLNSLLMGGIVFISALAGEGLTRYLYKEKIQLWKVWDRKAGGSIQVLGQTLGAYLFVPAFLAIDVLYYLLTTNYLGWWNPAGTLSDPDILAQNLPWFGSIAVSLQAGFWEEIICRAVPLAGVYLLVRNLKTKNLWMILTLLAQTIIFGSLHASYPQSPSYARVLEMVVPFIIFGLIYLRFGLLPIIITHYAVDVFWISLPLWVANSPGIWLNRIMIVLLLFVPLWIILYWRMKNKKWQEVPASELNGAWQAPVKMEVAENAENIIEENETIVDSKFLSLKWLVPGAIIGLVLWGIFTFTEKNQTPKVDVNRTQAIEMAKQELAARYAFNEEGWTVLTQVDNNPSDAHRFIWREYESSYDKLQKSFLNPPSWVIRFVKLDAPVEDRAEEYLARISVEGKVLSFRHNWPEKRQSESLSESEALVKAKSELAGFGVENTESLKLVNINPSKLEARTDWSIEFADTLRYGLEQGQGRYSVSIAGNEVNGIRKYVFVPENWQRAYDKQQSSLQIFTLISNLFLYSILIFGIVLGFINWSRKRFSTQMFWIFALSFFLLSAFRILNSWSDITSRYFTGLPYANFITMTLIGGLIGVVFLAMGVGVIGGFSCEICKRDTDGGRSSILKAVLLGALFAGLQTLKMSWVAQLAPNWLNLGNLNDQVVAFGLTVDQLQRFVFNPAFAMILFYLIGLVTKNFTTRKALGITFIFAAGFVAAGVGANSVIAWLGIGACSGIIFVLLFLLLKNHLNWLPVVFVIALLLQQLDNIWLNQHEGVAVGSIIALIVWGTAAYLWYNGIQKCKISK